MLIKEMQALCLNVEVLAQTGEEIEMRELDEDIFRTAEELGIDLSRPERGTDEEDDRRRNERPRPERALLPDREILHPPGHASLRADVSRATR